MTYYEYILTVALCAASISYTICYTSIFVWLREWLSKYHHKLEELIHCPYCFCHYVILTIMLTTDGVLVPISQSTLYNFLFTWFCIVCVTSLLHCIMLIAYEPVIKFMTDRRLEKLQMWKKLNEQQPKTDKRT